MTLTEEDLDEVYESIGMKVLEQWNSEMESQSNTQTSILSESMNSRLDQLLSCPPDHTDTTWSHEMKSTIEEMTAADFAANGKRLCMYLLERGWEASNLTQEQPIPMTVEGHEISISEIQPTGFGAAGVKHKNEPSRDG